MGYPRVYALSMATGATLTGALDLGDAFLYMTLEVPSMSAYFSGVTPIYIQVSSDGATYRRLSNLETNTAAAGVNDFSVASSVSSRHVPLPGLAHRYLKLETSATVSGAGGVPPFKLVCSQGI